MPKQPGFSAGVMILAAGKGTRMHSPLPKVLHEICGQPLLLHVLGRLRRVVPGAEACLIVGHGREKIEAAVRAWEGFPDLKISFATQAEQKGTGHAARCAMDSEWGARMVKAKASILVLPGDVPLVPGEMMLQMMQPLGRSADMRVLTCELDDPTGYGRIVRRGKKGSVLRIVEEKDAKLREKQIGEVNTSIYLFQAGFLKAGLARISNRNAQGEYYLTDLVAQAAARSSKGVDVLLWPSAEDLRGVNDHWELAEARKVLNERCVKGWAKRGVHFVDPATTWVDESVELSPESYIYPGAMLSGKTRIGCGVTVGPNVILKDVVVGDGANVKAGTVGESSEICAGAHVGPYAHLRPESVVGEQAKIGNFVELKKTRIGRATSVAHLSYLGDAEVGERVNIGCGFVTCNFDGRIINGARKHKTVIEDDVFMGSDCQTIAPVRVGKGSYVASGSSITEDVPPNALAIARSRQVNKEGYAAKLRAEQNCSEGNARVPKEKD